MKTKNLRVSLSFSDASDYNLESTARNVLVHVYNNPSFPAVPVPASSLEFTITAFATARVAHAKGARAATSERNARRIALVRLLQQVAFYVQMQSADDLPKLLSSGFGHVAPSLKQAKRSRPAAPTANGGWTDPSLLTA